jgi:glutaredoxin 3
MQKDNTDAAAQAADDHWTEHGSNGEPIEDQTVLVEIFGSATCTYCERAKEHCRKLGFEFAYKDIDADDEAFDQLVGRIGSWKTIPQIFIGPHYIGGFDDFKNKFVA